MIIENGTYCVALATSANEAYDEKGRPTPAMNEWSEPQPCCVQTISDSRIGIYADGLFRQASFNVLIDLQPFPYQRIRLTRQGEELGEFNVIFADPLISVETLKVMVAK